VYFSCYLQGGDAYIAGEPKESNPYNREHELYQHNWWNAGYDDAVKEDMKR
jgi:hypothetical protein